MNDERLLRHFLATLAYRVQKAIRDAPAGYSDFTAGNRVRTPLEILHHMTSVLAYARAQLVGGSAEIGRCGAWDDEVRCFHDMLAELSGILESGQGRDDVSHRALLQGPLADAMTHVGQLAMLRRLAGDPVEPENFMRARIDTANTGPEQAEPASPGRRDGSGADPVQ